jgi:hypothetical protein
MNLVTRWVILVQQELVMSLREMDGTQVMEDEGNFVVPHSFGSSEVFGYFETLV